MHLHFGHMISPLLVYLNTAISPAASLHVHVALYRWLPKTYLTALYNHAGDFL